MKGNAESCGQLLGEREGRPKNDEQDWRRDRREVREQPGIGADGVDLVLSRVIVEVIGVEVRSQVRRRSAGVSLLICLVIPTVIVIGVISCEGPRVTVIVDRSIGHVEMEAGSACSKKREAQQHDRLYSQ